MSRINLDERQKLLYDTELQGGIEGKDGKYRANRNPRYGVVTLVLYFGYQKRWNEAK